MRAVKMLSVAVAVLFGLAACGPKVATIDSRSQDGVAVEEGRYPSADRDPQGRRGQEGRRRDRRVPEADPTVATVDAATGKVTAVKSGDATIAATVDKITGSAQVKVSIPATVSIAPADVKLDGVGAKATVIAKVLDEKGRPVPAPLTWETADAKIATVANGEIISVAGGETQLHHAPTA